MASLLREQLYSTADYQAHDLTGIRLDQSNLSGWNFAGQNLTNANFYYATVTGADFTGAEVRGANFVGAAGYLGSRWNGFTAEQLYSTASYQSRDLAGIQLDGNNLTDWNFAAQNLSNATFASATLTGVNFAQANLTNALFRQATLTNADFTAADTRGAIQLGLPSSTITTNLIQPNGHISGLDLDAGGMLVVRDYDGKPTSSSSGPNPITVDQHFAMAPGSTLRVLLESDLWDSQIWFGSGIPVSRGGTLELFFADGTDLGSQMGRTIKLFNWGGVAPTGTFQVVSPFTWNLSKLYTTGEVTLAAVPEPSTFFLAAAGFGLCLARRRRRTVVAWFPDHATPATAALQRHTRTQTHRGAL